MAMFGAEPMTMEALKKAGIQFFTRAAPSFPMNALPHYKGSIMMERMDAILCTEVLAMLCALVGCQPTQDQLQTSYHFRYEPYYSDFIERAPERRSCTQLATAAWGFRSYAFDNCAGRVFKPIEEKPVLPVSNKGAEGKIIESGSSRSKSRKAASKSLRQLPAESQPTTDDDQAQVPHFSMQNLQEMAGQRSSKEKHPAAMTLSWFAGRIKEFATASKVFRSATPSNMLKRTLLDAKQRHLSWGVGPPGNLCGSHLTSPNIPRYTFR